MKNSLLSFILMAFVAMPLALVFAQEPQPCDSCAGYNPGSYMRSGGPELGGEVYHLSCESGTWVDKNADTGNDPCASCSPALGTQCADGAVYAGDDRGWPIYVAPCDAGMNWDGSTCTGSAGTYEYGGYGTDLNGDNASAVPELLDDGLANTDWLLTSGTGDHDAAQACRDKGAGWYLPAIEELGDLFANRAQLGPANLPTSTSWYWSSSEFSSLSARLQRFSDGYQTTDTKNYTHLVRCVRR